MRRADAIALGKLFPVPAEAKGNGPERVATLDDVVAAGHTITIVAIHDLYTTRR